MLGRDQLVAAGPDREQADRQVRRPGVGEPAEPGGDRRLVARREQFADVTDVAVLEKPLVVRRELGLGEDAVGARPRLVDPRRGAERDRDARDDARGGAPGPTSNGLCTVNVSFSTSTWPWPGQAARAVARQAALSTSR